MNVRFHSRRPARWPFWLLLAAWVCANAPAVAVCALLESLNQARHFAHHQRLVTEVAFVLVGQKAPGVLAAVKAGTLPAPLPAVPAEIQLKKIDLAVERAVEGLRLAARGSDFAESARAWPEARREPPPHEPPRVAAMG